MEQPEEFKKPENKNMSFVEFILLLLRWKKSILSSFVFTVIIAIIFTSPIFLPPEYKSEIIFYPPSNYSGKLMLGDLYFGVDKEVDEEIQILKSSILRDSLIAKYKLLQHYLINPKDEYKLDVLHEKVNNSIKIDRTRYNSISVIVYDTDPVMAANLANDMIKIGDEVRFQILRRNLKIIYANTEKEKLKQLKGLDILEKQINSVSNNLLKMNRFNAGETNKLDLLRAQIDIRDMIKSAIENKNNPLLNLLYEYETKFNQFKDIEESLAEINKKINSENINSFIISPAEVADKKFSPIRSQIILIVGICSLLITVALILLLEKYKEIKIKFQK